MPIIKHSTYLTRPVFLPSRHLETIIPSIFFKVDDFEFEPERLVLDDGDFLDLDWNRNNHRKLMISCHGLEGDSQRHYIKRSAKYFGQRGWDHLAWNYRGCGKELNRLPKQYYYGGIDDFSTVINHALSTNNYDQIVLLGFSMGGCLVNKYLGNTKSIDTRIKGGISFSVSCDLQDSANAVNRNMFGFYNKVFVSKLKKKLFKKANIFDEFESSEIKKIQSFDDYHSYYTLRFHDFKTIEDFYYHSSCIHYLDAIDRPNLIVNALNDPILGPKCYPYDLAKNSKYLYLETPRYGSHLGFTLTGKDYSWMEMRTEQFIEEIIRK